MVLKSGSFIEKNEDIYKVKDLYIGILNFIDINPISGRKIHIIDTGYSALIKDNYNYCYRVINRSRKDCMNRPLDTSNISGKVLPLRNGMFVDNLEPISFYTDEYQIGEREIQSILINKNKNKNPKVKTYRR